MKESEISTRPEAFTLHWNFHISNERIPCYLYPINRNMEDIYCRYSKCKRVFAFRCTFKFATNFYRFATKISPALVA